MEPVGRQVGEPAPAQRRGAEPGDRLAVIGDGAGARLRAAGEHRDEPALTAAVDAGDAEDLAGMNREVDGVKPVRASRAASETPRERRPPARRPRVRRASSSGAAAWPMTRRAIASSSIASSDASPASRPARSTVTWLASARTSRSLWEMNRMVSPAARRSRSRSNNSSVSGGVSTAVGSSRISTPHVARQRLEDLDLLLRGHGQRADDWHPDRPSRL